MSVLNKVKLAFVAGALIISSTAIHAKDVTIRVQSVLGTKSDKVHMLNEFANDVRELTGGSVNIEILPSGSVVGNREKALISVAWNWALERDYITLDNPTKVVKPNDEKPRDHYVTDK